MTLHLINARLIDPETLTDSEGSLLIENGPITALNAPAPKGATTIDCGGHRSVIQDQVEMGVAVRMACMDLLARKLRAERGAKAVGVMV